MSEGGGHWSMSERPLSPAPPLPPAPPRKRQLAASAGAEGRGATEWQWRAGGRRKGQLRAHPRLLVLPRHPLGCFGSHCAQSNALPVFFEPRSGIRNPQSRELATAVASTVGELLECARFVVRCRRLSLLSEAPSGTISASARRGPRYLGLVLRELVGVMHDLLRAPDGGAVVFVCVQYGHAYEPGATAHRHSLNEWRLIVDFSLWWCSSYRKGSALGTVRYVGETVMYHCTHVGLCARSRAYRMVDATSVSFVS